jgi:hypothetical protein
MLPKRRWTILTDLHIEAVEDKKSWSYEIPLKFTDGRKQKAILLKLDTGAAYTTIAASIFLPNLINARAEEMEQILSGKTAFTTTLSRRISAR